MKFNDIDNLVVEYLEEKAITNKVNPGNLNSNNSRKRKATCFEFEETMVRRKHQEVFIFWELALKKRCLIML